MKVRPERILMVVGGFHLIPYGRDYIQGLAAHMKDEYGIRYVSPAHCTGHLAFAIYRQVFGVRYKRFGLGDTLAL
ncbi:MAG: hypothetical protein ABIO61_07070 [Thermomonas sp.]